MKKGRDIYLDIIKATCIILVILGHCIQYGSGSMYLQGEFFGNPVFAFIYSFHMPLFMLISGYLFAYSLNNRKWYEILLIKFRQLIIPLFVWSVITLLINVLKVITGVELETINILWIIKKLISGFIYGPWFLWAVWWCSFVIIIVRRFFKDSLFVYILGSLLTFIIPDVFNLALYKFMWPFFLLAYIFNTNNYIIRWKKIYLNKVFELCCFIIFAILLMFYSHDSYIYTSGYTVLNKNVLVQVYNNIFRFFIGIVGSISVMYSLYALVQYLPNKIKRLLAYIGENTLGIYIVSNILFSEVLKRVTSSLTGINYMYILFETICVLCISIFINALIKRFRITNVLLLGGR